ncbi:MAG: tetratricopeptide repeat protein [candidate division NC10 bacterium]|nr:tetratricopeptide repeat protein [candidate division NC10 bacterium]MDE2321236.1 tetratricopeptide repeat protein [candidate division NC10 bacterium]
MKDRVAGKKTKRVERVEASHYPFGWLLPVGIALLAGVVVYSNTFSVPFVFDDFDTIVADPRIRVIQNMRDLPKIAFHFTSIGAFLSRSVLFASFAVNHALGGVDPTGYHIVNLLLHLVVVLCTFLLARQLLEALTPGDQMVGLVATTAALTQAIHPIFTEAVVFISGRSSVLCAAFYLGSVLAFGEGERVASQRRKWGWYLLSAISGILAFGSKQEAATLPVMLLLYSLVFQHREEGIRGWARRNWPLLVGVGLAAAIFLFYSWGMVVEPHPDGTLSRPRLHHGQQLPRLQYFLTQLQVIPFYYLRLFLFPVGLNIDPDIPPAPGWLDVQTVLGALILIGLTVAGVLTLRKAPMLAFAIGWFLIAPIPSSSIVPLLDVAAEHRVYLAGVGFALFVGWLSGWLAEKYGKVQVGVIVGIVAMAWGLGTIQRNTVWQDERALWLDAATKSPQKSRPHLNLAIAYLNHDQTALAIEEARRGVELQPDYAAFRVLGSAYLDAGRIEEAVSTLEKALELNPDGLQARLSLARAYARQGRYDLALARYQELLQRAPTNAKLHVESGAVFLRAGRKQEAIALYRKALELNPRWAEPFLTLAALLEADGRVPEAIGILEDYLRLNPTAPEGEQVRQALAKLPDRKS